MSCFFRWLSRKTLRPPASTSEAIPVPQDREAKRPGPQLAEESSENDLPCKKAREDGLATIGTGRPGVSEPGLEETRKSLQWSLSYPAGAKLTHYLSSPLPALWAPRYASA